MTLEDNNHHIGDDGDKYKAAGTLMPKIWLEVLKSDPRRASPSLSNVRSSVGFLTLENIWGRLLSY